MTVATTAAAANFPWDGTQANFPSNFVVKAAADLIVTHIATATNITTPLALGVQYGVAIDPATSYATVTPIALPAAAGTIAVKRMTSLAQPAIIAGDSIAPDVLQDVIDRAALRDQDMRRDIDALLTLMALLSVSPYANLPITRGQALLSLKQNATAGVNWLTAVEAALSPLESDTNNIRFSDAFWPVGGAAWAFVLTALANALPGGFTNAQLAALQTQAIAFKASP